jgi:tRNA U54 and U55 pseudouridine synthase Pus10
MDKKVVTSVACGGCHDRDDVHNGNFGDRCERCHDGDDWKHVKMGVAVPQKKAALSNEPLQKVSLKQEEPAKATANRTTQKKVAKKKEKSKSVFEQLTTWGGL